jgi:outer membrane protein assembly factor BamE (lipoprotein component of BamABCDE complex)
MQALLMRDRALIAPAERPKIGDSLDLDAAFKKDFPNANRWDYVFSVATTGKLIALEPHIAKDSEISVLIAKKKHAATQLRAHFQPQYGVSEWLWVSHGRTSFSRMEQATRRLAQAGIRYLGRSVDHVGE